ncbi:MAG TPA: hypothetical protein VF538_06595 [Pyrinomonadaceae bacterium]|jgi:chromosome segregation ATPase
MSDEKTHNLPDGRSFEERVFARFDALDARMSSLESQLGGVRERLGALEQKSYDTKPIWERALAEILALGEKMENIEGKVDTLASDLLELRANQNRLGDRMGRLESKPAT